MLDSCFLQSGTYQRVLDIGYVDRFTVATVGVKVVVLILLSILKDVYEVLKSLAIILRLPIAHHSFYLFEQLFVLISFLLQKIFFVFEILDLLFQLKDFFILPKQIGD